MKIPYHSKKIESDFKAYLKDFKNCLNNNTNLKSEFFKNTYPFFVLIESIKESDNIIDPSQRLILDEALERNDAETIARASRNLFAKDDLLKMALKKQVFTPYFHELYSDSIMLLNAYYMNNYRGAYIALRTMLEDLYRHLYYKDHPEEFFAIQHGEDEHNNLNLSPQKFREYLPRTSYLKFLSLLNDKFEKGTDKPKPSTIFDLNNKCYQDTSAYVHASKEICMNNFISNSHMIFDENESKKLIATSKNIMTIAVTFLICAHKLEFMCFSDYTKSLIFEVFDKTSRHCFRKEMNI